MRLCQAITKTKDMIFNALFDSSDQFYQHLLNNL